MSVSRVSFLWDFVQLFSDETIMTLKVKPSTAYHPHAIILNSYPHWCSSLIVNGHSVVGFLLVGKVESRERFGLFDVTFESLAHFQLRLLKWNLSLP